MTEDRLTQAIVLDKEPDREADTRVFLYTRDFGKVIAKATSARKILSKLASHLEPGNIIDVRLVSKNSFQITDALKVFSLIKSSETVRALNLIKELAPERVPDDSLWEFLIGGNLNGAETLRILGFDSQFAVCDCCGANDPAHFLFRELDYRCSSCFLKSGRPAGFAIK